MKPATITVAGFFMPADQGVIMLETIEEETAGNPQYSVIWLHGLGADGHDFAGVVPELHSGKATRYIFPHAPVMPVTLNNGMRMRSWFDICGLDADSPEDAAGMASACAEIALLIEREKDRGIRESNIILSGFSQGGAIALLSGLFGGYQLGGVMGLSTWLPSWRGAMAHNMDIPVLMAHGTEDPVVLPSMGMAARDNLQQQGFNVEWHEYPMQHTVTLEELEDISAWLRRCMN